MNRGDSTLSGLRIAAFLVTISALAQGAPADILGPCASSNPDQSISACTAIVARRTRGTEFQRAKAFHLRGIAYLRKADTDRAIADFSESLRLDPMLVEAAYARAIAYVRKGDRSRAIADYDMTIRMKPAASAAYFGRGLVYSDSGDNGRAIADFNQAIRLDPKNADQYYQRGNAHKANQDDDNAIADFDRAIRLSPKTAVLAYVSRGQIFFKRSILDRAFADFDQAVQVDPIHANTYDSRGAAYAQMGDQDRAIADFDTAIRLNPKKADYYRNRGVAYRQKGDDDRAIADFDQALRIDPSLARTYKSRGLAYEHKGEHAHAIADYDEAIRLSPRDAEAYFNRGFAHAKNGDHGQAISDYDEVIRLNPANIDAHYNRGLSFAAKGEPERAIADYGQSIRLKPTYANAYFNRAVAYARSGDLDRAIPDYDQAIRLNSTNADAFFNRGLIFEQKGELGKSRDDFLKALGLKPGDSVKKRALARIDQKIEDVAAPHLAVLPRPAAVAKLPSGPVPELKLVTDKRVALVIGNAHYLASGVLANPGQDAAAVAEELRGDGFDVTILNDATRVQMTAALRKFRAQADVSDWAVVFYAGHGIEMGGKNYLLPTDAHIESDRDIEEEAVPLARVESAIEGAHHLRLVILDACRNNPFLARMVRTASVSRSVERGFARVEPHPGTLIVFAAKEGETADDGGGAHSPFTTSLLAQMRKPGLEVRRLFDYVRDDVLEATKNRQMPFSYGSLPARRDFFFVSASIEKP